MKIIRPRLGTVTGAVLIALLLCCNVSQAEDLPVYAGSFKAAESPSTRRGCHLSDPVSRT